MIRLFLSHSSVDAGLAAVVVRLLRASLRLEPSEIRCTSVDGYKLPGGADTDEQLRGEVQEAEVLVALVSAASLQSLYVTCELGARWGVGKPLIPLLAPGVQPWEIKAPLAGKNLLKSERAAELHQLIDDVGGHLGITPARPAAYQEDLETVLALTAPPSSPPARPRDLPTPLPDGFALAYGINWDMRAVDAVPYCVGCRTASGNWVALSCHEYGFSSVVKRRTYVCPLGHPSIVLEPDRFPPMTPFKMQQLAAQWFKPSEKDPEQS